MATSWLIELRAVVAGAAVSGIRRRTCSSEMRLTFGAEESCLSWRATQSLNWMIRANPVIDQNKGFLGVEERGEK